METETIMTNISIPTPSMMSSLMFNPPILYPFNFLKEQFCHSYMLIASAPLANYETLGDGFGLSRKKKPNPRRKVARRDIYQRKAYAVHRMSLAAMRLSRTTSQTEKDKASYWAKMWGAVSGIRQFRLGNGGGNGNGGDRR
jgi:hypothetical protein